MKNTPKARHECVKCHKTFPHSFTTFCECGGMIDVEYDLKKVTFPDSSNSLERFFDLLPVENPDHLLSQSIEFSPCVHAKDLGSFLGMPNLYLKNETVLPTCTTKDRMAAVSLAFLHECGVRAFCTSSTGNSSSAFAQGIQRYPDCRMFLFTAEDFHDRVQYEETEQIVHFVLRDATFVDAFQFAAEFGSRHNVTSERGFFNPGRREGLKMAFLEAAEQIPPPIDWYVQAVSSAMGVYGSCKAARQLLQLKRIPRLPRLLCVQQETCAPMVHAFEAGSEVIRPEDIVRNPTGIAQAILRGDPTKAYPYVREIVLETGGSFVSVTENEIREARKMVEEFEGISPCFSAAAALAGVVNLIRKKNFPHEDTVMVNLTGGDRPRSKHLPKAHWLRRNGKEWMPEDPKDALAWGFWKEK